MTDEQPVKKLAKRTKIDKPIVETEAPSETVEASQADAPISTEAKEALKASLRAEMMAEVRAELIEEVKAEVAASTNANDTPQPEQTFERINRDPKTERARAVTEMIGPGGSILRKDF